MRQPSNPCGRKCKEGAVLHIGVTPTNGAETPAYNPYVHDIVSSSPRAGMLGQHVVGAAKERNLTLASPSLATVRRTTSIAPLYTPFSAVCSRTLTRSKGCPTRTAHTPPTPPATSDRKLDAVAAVAALTSSATSDLEGREEVAAETVEEEVDAERLEGVDAAEDVEEEGKVNGEVGGAISRR